MKKKRNYIWQTVSVFLILVLVLTSMPVMAEEEFTASEEETQQQSVETEEFDDEIFNDGNDIQQDFSSDNLQDNFQNEKQDNDSGTEGIRYIKGRPLTQEEKEEQLAPFETLVPLDPGPEAESCSDETGVAAYSMRKSPYPQTYDMRELNYVTSAKDQNPYGNCWAFGMAAIMESSLLTQNKGIYDLSEDHLSYFFSHRQNDPLNNTPYDTNIVNGNHRYAGGNDTLASIFLTTWSGMTTEEDVPLPTDSVSAQKAYHAVAYLKNAYFFNYSQQKVKDMLMGNHAVSVMLPMNRSYCNPDTAAYCYSSQAHGGENHIVTIVGWDDNYSRDNYLDQCNVTSDGAWIAKNSWGSDWGDNGFFYISYESTDFKNLVAADAVNSVKYNNNYFYDGSSAVTVISLDTGQSVAAIFDVKAGKGKAETLGEINLISRSDPALYEIQVYANLKDPSNPTSGSPVYSSPIQYYQSVAGVRTISLPETTLIQNTKFSVVIKNKGENQISFGVEYGYSYGWFTALAGIEKGQTFFRGQTGAKWTDACTESWTARIKAHTRTQSSPVTPRLSVNPDRTTLNIGQTACMNAQITPYSVKYIGLSYQSSNKSVASVDVNGKITARNPGTAVITCRSVDSTGLIKKITITVNPPRQLSTPKFTVSVSSNGYNKISWKKVSGAQWYTVWRRPGKGGKWTRLANVKSSVLAYKDYKVTANASYRYTVRAYQKAGEKIYSSKYVTGTIIKAAPARQKIYSARAEGGIIRISWKTQKNCDGYRVYRRTRNGKYKRLYTFSKGTYSTYLDKTAVKGVLYFYAVRAYVKEPDGVVFSKYTDSSAVKR